LLESSFLLEALPQHIAWDAERPPLTDLPGSPAVYQLQDHDGRHVLLATTQHLRRAVTGRLTSEAGNPTRRADLAAVARRLRWRTVSCAFESRWWHYRLARVLHPADYRKRLGFRPAWFLWVDWQRAVPEIRVSERMWTQPGEFVGPWGSQRTASEALQGLWDLFDLCRYPEQIRRTPRGTRCAYFDMRRCDAPCDGTAPVRPYIERCRTAWRFACPEAGRPGVDDAPGPRAWMAAATTRMRQAAEEQRFEDAALLKNQIAFAQRWLSEWQQQLRTLSDFNFLIALPAARRRAWKLFVFRAGEFADGPLLKDRELPAGAVGWFESLASESRAPCSSEGLIRMEQTWLMAHLLHSREAQTGAIVGVNDSENLADRLSAALDQACSNRPARSSHPAPVNRPDLANRAERVGGSGESAHPTEETAGEA
jgi:DNA polymerase-3 subunit epsilon